jgi:hypothetical protein
MSPRVRVLTTTLALLAVAAGYALSQGWVERQSPRPMVREAGARPVPPPAPVPSAREILDRGPAVGLSREQAARLRALDAEWVRQSSELQAAIDDEERHFSAFMKEAQGGRGASLQEIQRRSAILRDLSATLREARWQHGLASAEVLTEQQRRTQGDVR